MDQLHETLDKLFTEADILQQATETDELGPEQTRIALSVAKRVRREAQAAVRLLAQARDAADAEVP